MFTAETLDLIEYEQKRGDALSLIDGVNKFRWEFKTYIANEAEHDLIYMKNAIEVLAHILESDGDDVDLIKQSLYTFDSIDGVTNKGKQTLGHLLMKAMHSINNSDGAFDVRNKSNCEHMNISNLIIFVIFQLYNDPKLNIYFGGFKSTLICLDLLYNNGNYDKIIQIDKHNRQTFGEKRTMFSKFIDVLVLGACYKLVCSIVN